MSAPRSIRMVPILAAVAALAGACGGGGGGGGNGDGGLGCAQNVLQIYFNPMYSAYDGTHLFQIPAEVTGVDPSGVGWTASDPSMVSLTPDPAVNGIMITVQKAGTVNIIAQVTGSSVCGSATLTIDNDTPDDWEAGNERYNDSIFPDGGRFGGLFGCDGGECNNIACTYCHGPTSSPNAPVKDVAHTPQQTGGFSDSDLESIIRQGSVPGWLCDGGTTGYGEPICYPGPDAGYFDPSILPYSRWHDIHQWSMTDQGLQGVICYLRSLTPVPQEGSSNFGGHGPGGGHHGDGGYGGPGGGGTCDGGGC